jgi:hypothetical protein
MIALPGAAIRLVGVSSIALAGLVIGACSAGPLGPGPSATAVVITPAPPPAASGAPPPDQAVQLESRLLEILDAPDLAYRFEQTAAISTGQAELSQSVTGEVSGPDLHMTLTITQDGQETVTEIAVVDGQSFQRSGSGAWADAGPVTADASILPRLDPVFDAATIRYVGHEIHEGNLLQHLALTSPVPLTDDFEGWLPSLATNGTIDSLDLFVESDGSPVDLLYELSFELPMDSGSEPLQLHGTYRQSFRDLGQDISIEVPGLPTPSG